MLTTFDVGPHTGRVCYCTETRKQFVTIECPAERLALRFETEDRFKIGDWVTITGTARIDATIRASGTPAEPSAYYHQPHDGSNRIGWAFKQLTSAIPVLVGPPQFSKRMHEAMLCLRRHLDSWEKNLELSKWEETAGTLRDVLRMVENEIRERKPAPIVALQISDV